MYKKKSNVNRKISSDFWFMVLVTMLLVIPPLLFLYGLNIKKINFSDLINNGNVILSAAKISASVLATILGLYILWFRVNQTSNQISIQVKQLEDLERERKVNAVRKEINTLYDEIMVQALSPTRPPKEIIEKAINDLGKSCKWQLDHSSMLVNITDLDNKNHYLQWEGPVKYLKVLTVEPREEEQTIKSYNVLDEKTQVTLQNIGKSIEVLIFQFYQMLNIDKSNANEISLKTGRIKEIVELLFKANLIKKQYYDIYGVLCSISQHLPSIQESLHELFSYELKSQGVITDSESYKESDLQVFRDGESINFRVKVDEFTYTRTFGKWIELND